MISPEQQDKIQQDMITSLTEEIGQCRTTNELLALCSKYEKECLAYYLEDYFKDEREYEKDSDTEGFDLARRKYNTVRIEADKRIAIEKLNDPSSSEEERSVAHSVLWSDAIHKLVSARVPTHHTQEQFLAVLNEVLQEVPHPDGHTVTLSEYQEHVVPVLPLD